MINRPSYYIVIPANVWDNYKLKDLKQEILLFFWYNY